VSTRFYFSASLVPPNSPGFAAWTRTTEGVRRKMDPRKDDSAMTGLNCWANGAVAANASALAVQFASRPMAAGVAFLTTNTIKCQVRCQESAINDNINRQPICVKVYNGTTLQATLVGLGHIGPGTTEWSSAVGGVNRTAADGDLLTGLGGTYTTVDGDYLVVELGGQVSSAGGTSVTGTLSIGSNSGTDLGENETDTAENNPWFEISTDVIFANAPPVFHRSQRFAR